MNRRKKACKTLFKGPAAETQEAFEALHELRIAAKELRYTANAAAFALDQKFHAHEAFYKDIQDQLGLINDKRVWLETLQSIGREKAGCRQKKSGPPSPIRCGQRYWKLSIRTRSSLLLILSPPK
ncbi:CHAD domain-containing protein [Paenibacillus rhizoplanae]